MSPTSEPWSRRPAAERGHSRSQQSTEHRGRMASTTRLARPICKKHWVQRPQEQTVLKVKQQAGQGHLLEQEEATSDRFPIIKCTDDTPFIFSTCCSFHSLVHHEREFYLQRCVCTQAQPSAHCEPGRVCLGCPPCQLATACFVPAGVRAPFLPPKPRSEPLLILLTSQRFLQHLECKLRC